MAVLGNFGYRALLGMGVFDGDRGNQLKIFSDRDHADLAALACEARVLAHYCAAVTTSSLRVLGGASLDSTLCLDMATCRPARL